LTFTVTPIGVIRSPFAGPEGMPIQPSGAKEVEGEAILDPAYAEGLADLEGFSHLILLYWFHRSEGYALKVTPFLDTVPRGLFATRAPRRPNPIGLSVVELLRRRGNRLSIRGVDVVDGTPLLDVKPHVPAFDAPAGTRIGWMEGKDGESRRKTSDGRFVPET
jgi:tRNA-Thr(GGU) m(6)t(6)A37 methyltransferase TsaA